MYDRPSYPGGPIINYNRLLPALADKCYEVHVLALYRDGYPNAKGIEKRGVKIHPHPFINDSREAVKWILQKAEEIQPDVYIPDVSTPGCFAGKWLRKSGIPVINSHRSDDENNWGRAIYFSDPDHDFTTDAIFAVNSYLLKSLKKKVSNPDLHTAVIPSGVIVPKIYSKQKNDHLSVVYAGRIIQQQKRISETLDIIISLAKLNNSLRFTLIGDGPEMSSCKHKVIRAGYNDRIAFKGLLLADEYRAELAKHDVIVLLSDYEGTPGSLMDGMAAGLIPICYNYQGADELVIQGETGFLVNDRNKAVMAAIQQLINNPELRKHLSVNARRHIIENFTIASAVKRWEILISKLLAQSVSMKKPFVMPRRIKLPPPIDMLVEYNVVKKPFLKKLRARLQLRTRLKRLFFLQ